MTKIVRGILEGPTVLRLDEPVELPLHVPVEVAISAPADVGNQTSTLLALASTLQLDGPTDLSERWEEYLADEDVDRQQ